eukprot:GEMP01043496.1.p1 GENE.GEMP01043496.1~~GEMP01043496.1.p1  ORF type:complete len:305 (+),score=84.99 GEMP01043496.1:207-1121(+)
MSSAVVPRFFTARLLNGTQIRTRQACATLLDVKLDLAEQLGTFLAHLELITADFVTVVQSDAEIQKLLSKDVDIMLYAVVNAPVNAADLGNEQVSAHWVGVVRAHAKAADVEGIQRAVQFINDQGEDGDDIARTTLVQLIALHGAVRMAEESTPQEDSAMRTVNTFVRAKVDVSKGSAQMRERTALMVAVEYGLDHILDCLFAAGVDPDVTNDHGSTALMFAAREGRRQIVQRLIEHGADLYIADINGVNALGYASLCGNHDVVNSIIDMTSTETDHASVMRHHFEGVPELRRRLGSSIAVLGR